MSLVRFCRVSIRVDQQAREEDSSMNAAPESKNENRDQNTRVSTFEESDKTNDDDDEKEEEEEEKEEEDTIKLCKLHNHHHNFLEPLCN